MKNVKLITSLVLVLLAIVVALQNTDQVRIHVLLWTGSMSGALLLMGTFAAGALAGLVAGLWMARSRRSVPAGTNAREKGARG